MTSKPHALRAPRWPLAGRPADRAVPGQTGPGSRPADIESSAFAPGRGTAAGQADAGARELLGQLYQAHALTLIRAAKLLLRDEASAEDVVQEAFISLYRALPRLHDRDDLLPYLRTTVINKARTALRRRRRDALRPVHHELPAASAESAVLAADDRREVLAAIARLPRRSREVLVLRYYLDLSEQEIATTLDISRGTVSSTASRALSAIARDLKEDR
jgi:RNA polymerase sigma-70 factor (sigma-E family)